MPRHLTLPLLPTLLVAGVVAAFVAVPAAPASAFQPVVELPGYSSTDQVAVDSPLHRVFVLGDDAARPGGRLLATIDSRTDTIVGSPVPVAGGDFVAVDPVSHRVVLTDIDAGTVTILDAATGATIATSARLGRRIGQVVVDPYAARLFVMDDQQHLLTLDEAGAAVAPTVTIPRSGTRLAVDFTRQKVYVPTDDRSVAVVDAQSDRLVGSIAIPDAVGAIVVDPLDGRAMVSTPTSVITLDTRTDVLISTLAMPNDVNRALGVDFIAHTFVVTESDSTVVTVTRGVQNRLAVDRFGAMAVDYLLHKVYSAYQHRPWASVVWL